MVRCKDCKYWHFISKGKAERVWGWCGMTITRGAARKANYDWSPALATTTGEDVAHLETKQDFGCTMGERE